MARTICSVRATTSGTMNTLIKWITDLDEGHMPHGSSVGLSARLRHTYSGLEVKGALDQERCKLRVRVSLYLRNSIVPGYKRLSD